MPEHMIAPAENTDSNTQFFQGVITMINSSIGREMDNTERQAIAFVVERKYKDGIEPDVFLREILGVGKDVSGSPSGRDAALQIHSSVFKEKLSRIHELMGENSSDSEKLNAWKEQMNIGHNTTLDSYNTQSNYIPYIGGVSMDWVPAWFK
jgi:hypothetical protein